MCARVPVMSYMPLIAGQFEDADDDEAGGGEGGGGANGHVASENGHAPSS